MLLRTRTLLGPFTLLTLAACRRDAGDRPVLYLATQVAITPPTLELGDVRALAVDPRGDVLVGDLAGRVFELGPDARPRRSLGGQAEGAGAFDAVDGVSLLPGDSLLVFDGSRERIAVFPQGRDTPARAASVSTGAYLFPYWLAPADSAGRMWAAYRAAYGDAVPAAPARHSEVLRLLASDGRVLRDSVLVFPEMETLRLRGQVDGVAVDPFGRRRLFARAPDGVLYTAWSGRLKIDLLGARGRHPGSVRPRFAAEARKVTAAERDSVIAAMARAFPAATVRRAFAERGKPRWPLFREMFVDREGLLWLGFTPRPGGAVAWRAFRRDGALQAGVDLPQNESLRMVAGSRGYVVRRDSGEVERVVIYSLSRPTAAEPR